MQYLINMDIFVNYMISHCFLGILPSGDLTDIATETAGLYISVKYLCYALASLFGLVGGLKIYNQWQLHGKHHLHIESEIVAWIGGSVFFLLAGAIIQAILL